MLTQEEEKEYETKENEDKTCEVKENEEEKKDDDNKNKSQAEDAEGDIAKKVDPNDVLSLLVKTRQSARRKEAEMKKKDVIKMDMNRSPHRLPSLTLLVDVPGMKTVGSEELPEAKTSCASAPGPENNCMWRVAQVWTYPSCQCLTHPSVYSCECQCLVFCYLFW